VLRSLESTEGGYITKMNSYKW